MSEPTGGEIFAELKNHMDNLGWGKQWPEVARHLATPPFTPSRVAALEAEVVALQSSLSRTEKERDKLAETLEISKEYTAAATRECDGLRARLGMSPEESRHADYVLGIVVQQRDAAVQSEAKIRTVVETWNEDFGAAPTNVRIEGVFPGGETWEIKWSDEKGAWVNADDGGESEPGAWRLYFPKPSPSVEAYKAREEVVKAAKEMKRRMESKDSTVASDILYDKSVDAFHAAISRLEALEKERGEEK